MPVKIRLMRVGAKKRPFYRIVAVDERRKRTGGYLELLGTYNPLTQPKEIILKQDLIDNWIKKGAVLSDGYLRIIGKAPQRLPRKPKKEKSEPAAAPAQPVAESAGTPTNESSEAIEKPAPVETQPEEQAEVSGTPTEPETPSEINETPAEPVEELAQEAGANPKAGE